MHGPAGVHRAPNQSQALRPTAVDSQHAAGLEILTGVGKSHQKGESANDYKTGNMAPQKCGAFLYIVILNLPAGRQVQDDKVVYKKII